MREVPGKPLERAGALDEPTIDEFYDQAACGYLSLSADGVIVRVNETFVRWTGRSREELLTDLRFPELLTVGGRLYYETHCAPMLAVGQELREVALDVRRADGSILLALMGATVHPGEDGRSSVVRLTVFDASHRRGFERHLMAARNAERRGREDAEALGRISDRLAMLDTTTQISAAVVGELMGGGYARRAELVLRGAGTLPSHAQFTVADDGSTTSCRLPVPSGGAEVLGTLLLECDGAADDIDRAFLQSAADLAGRAIARTQRAAARARATRQGGSGGLPNERWWSAALKAAMLQAKAEGTELSVAVVEVSRLEQVTMTDGIGAADRLLIAVSDAWREAGLDLLSRFGGEEFAVLMPGLDAAVAKATLARIKRNGDAGRQLSAGVATWDRRESAVSLMSRAERALGDSSAH